MTEQRPKRLDAGSEVTAAQWADFLEARVKEELEAVDAVNSQGWWELTEPGARRFGVQGMGGRVFAPILTGSGHWLDQATALHIVRNQPRRTRDDLRGKLMLIGLLRAQIAEEGEPLVGPLRLVVQQFAAPFIDHPDHPEYQAPEEP
ncbi:DUF6221 family protein [Streptomyces chrestomyceticus]|uniref:DUF6221 family protein n=1 Tax=Streptomyces chrestomyceticus TaxID=68185 RepID=UPI0033D0B7D7